MKKALLILVLIFSFVLFGCEEKENPIDDEVVIEDVSIYEATIPSEINIDDFDINDVKIKITLSNDEIRDVYLTEEMLADGDLEKLAIVGTHTITFTYEGITKSFTITLVDDEDLPDGPKEITISEVVEAELGKYSTKGTVVGVNAQSFLLQDESGTILVYKGKNWNCDLQIGDKVKITGTTTTYAKAIQFGSDTEYEKISSGSYTQPKANAIDGLKVTQLAALDKAEIQYVKVAGVLTISGNYYNLTIEGTSVVGSITYPIAIDELNALKGKAIEVEGYYTGISGSTTQYLNILCINISELKNTTTDTITIAEALAAKQGEEVVIQGEVTAIYQNWDSNYNNMSVYLTDETGTIIAFRITEKVEVGYIIKVTGLINVYNEVNQIAQGSITEVIERTDPVVTDLIKINEVKLKADEAGTSGALVSFVGIVVGFDSMGYAQVGDETGLIYVRAKHELLVKDAKVKIKGYTTIYQGSSSAYPEYTRQIKADGIEVTKYEGEVGDVKEAVVLDSSELIENKNYKDTTIHGNLITISGIVEVGSSKYNYYLNDEQGNHIIAIHHYSNNFERFNSLNGKLVTLTGVVYRYYTAEDIWSLQLIGLNEELVVTNQDDSETINFVMINDTHGAFIDDVGVPGIGRVSSVIDELELMNGEYIKIANGDIFQGSYVSNVLYGRPLIDALNKMEFDVFVLGNHEFDWGLDRIANYKDGNLANGEANFPFLGANVIDKKTNEIVDWLEPYVIINYGDYKVGIIGVIGETQESSILTENVTGYDFTDASDAVEKYAVELRTKEKCDVVVVASHDYDEYTNYEIANFDSDARIDAIFCAHTHQKISTNITRNDGYKIPVVQNYDKNETMAEVVIKMSNANEANGYYSNFYSPSNYGVDSDLEDVISLYQNEINEGNRVLGTTSYTIDKATLGSYATDAMLTEYSADVAIINTGGVREKIGSGDITVSDVFNVFPFNNEIILVELTGSALISLYNENSNYLYFNEEFSTYLINSSSTYEVVVIDYVFTSPYYTQFEGAEYTDTNVVMRDIFIEYIDNLY